MKIRVNQEVIRRSKITIIVIGAAFLGSFVIFIIPTLDSRSPEIQNTNSVPVNSNITLNFSQAIDGGVSASNIVLRGEQSGLITTVITGSGTNQIVVNPNSDFFPGEKLSLVLTNGLTNSGDPLAPLEYRFLAAAGTADEVIPQVYHPLYDFVNNSNVENNLAAGDIDSDGDIDIVAASGSLNEIRWYRNEGNGSFTEISIISGLSKPLCVQLADLDDDGDMDIVYGQADNDLVQWLKNDGSENFASNSIGGLDIIQDLRVGDIDRDGDLDVVASGLNALSDKIVWYENNGSEAFSAHAVSTFSHFAFDLELIDVDNNGETDIVFKDIGYAIWWYANNGTSVWSGTTLSSGTATLTLEVGDLDNDGDVDFFPGLILENNGSQTFTTGQTGFSGSLSTSLVDVNSDGLLDIGGGGSDLPDGFTWWINQGNLQFTKMATGVAPLVRSSVPADIDNDGDMDLVIWDNVTIAWLENGPNPAELNALANATLLESGAGTFDFGSGVIGYPITYTFLVKNVGDLDLTFDATTPVAISGTDAADFSLSDELAGIALSTDEQQIFGITFDPSSEGSKTATVTIASDDPNNPTYTFTVNAIAVLAPVDCEIPSGDMETTYTGSVAQLAMDFSISGVAEYEVPSGWKPYQSLAAAALGSAINVQLTTGVTGNGIYIKSDGNGTGDLLGIFPCSTLYRALQGYYKFTGSATDSAVVILSTGGSLESNRTATNTDTIYFDSEVGPYSFFKADFLYDEQSVDSLMIYLTTTSNASPVFYLDDLSIVQGTIPKMDQTITFDAIPDKTYGDAPFPLSASSDSGLDIFWVYTGPIDIGVDDMVTITGAGMAEITAVQPGDDAYNPAENVTRTFTIAKATQTITFNTISPQDYTAGLTLNLTASSDSGLPIVFTIEGPAGGISGNVATFNAPGEYTITANQSGNENYEAASAMQTFCINPPKPTISFSGSGTSSMILTSSFPTDNVWFKDGVELSSTGQTITITEPGVYEVQVVVGNCAGQVSNILNIIITDLEDINSEMIVYPNPSSKSIILQFSTAWIGQELGIKLMGADGKVVVSQKKKLEYSSEEIDISALPDGLYFLQVSSGNKVINQRILKQQ